MIINGAKASTIIMASSGGTNQISKSSGGGCEGEVDRISELPDEIIHNILTLLGSQKRGAKTSVLSKRWGEVWRSYPILEFDPAQFRSKQSAERFAAAAAQKFSTDLSMAALRVPIDLSDDDDWGQEFWSALLDGLLDLAARKSVQEIHITPWFEYDPHPLLRGGQSFRCLKVVDLYYCDFRACDDCPLPGGLGTSLTDLVLNQILTSIIAAAPLLRKLTLQLVQGIRKLQVRNRASLKFFRLSLCYGVEDLEITGAHSLEVLDLVGVPLGGDFVVSSMPNLKVLQISYVEKLTEKKLNELISKCPSLKSLQLKIPRHIRRLKMVNYDAPLQFRLQLVDPELRDTVIEIDDPKLRTVYYDGLITLSPPIILRHKGSTREDDGQPDAAAVSFYWKLDHPCCHNLRQFLHQLNHFRLTLDFSAVELDRLRFEVENEAHVPLIEYVKLPWTFWTLYDKDGFLGRLFHNCWPKYLSFTDKNLLYRGSNKSVLSALHVCVRSLRT